jgi:hypothetical protein
MQAAEKYREAAHWLREGSACYVRRFDAAAYRAKADEYEARATALHPVSAQAEVKAPDAAVSMATVTVEARGDRAMASALTAHREHRHRKAALLYKQAAGLYIKLLDDPGGTTKVRPHLTESI